MPVEVIYGQSPLIVILPYAGLNLPKTIYSRLTEVGRSFSDSDSYLGRLVSDLAEQPTIVRANFQRCAADTEVDPSGSARKQFRDQHIGVIPLYDRDGHEIWAKSPTIQEASHWRAAYYAPFHAALNAQIARIRARHQRAVVVTLHTLRADDHVDDMDIVVSTDLTSPGAVSLSTQLTRVFGSAEEYRCLLTGKASARWITRQHSKPDLGVYALQISIRPDCYLTTDGEAGLFDDDKAAPLRELLNLAFQLLIDHKHV